MSEETPASRRRQILAWLHPWTLAGHTVTYLIGLGAAHYLGAALNAPAAWLGWLWTLSLQAGMFLLEGTWADTPRASAPPPPERVRLERRAIFAGFALLALTASLTVTLARAPGAGLSVWVLMGASFALLGWYALPPWNGARRGYGEILLAMAGSNLVPALAFTLQTGTVHRLLAMVTFALPLLYIASQLALELETYAADLKYLRYTLLLRLGWEQGMRVHNGLVGAALLVMGAALGMGLSPRLGLPPLLSLSWGGFQIWYLGRIREGMAPDWRILRLSAALLYALPACLTAFTLWSG